MSTEADQIKLLLEASRALRERAAKLKQSLKDITAEIAEIDAEVERLRQIPG